MNITDIKRIGGVLISAVRVPYTLGVQVRSPSALRSSNESVICDHMQPRHDVADCVTILAIYKAMYENASKIAFTKCYM